ncbi:MAG: magnesium chelatase, partial [Bacteroidota bacterium]|jgi:magnesium chelatase subunit I
METIFAEGGIVLYDESDSVEHAETLNNIEPLEFLLNRYQPDFPQTDKLFLKELVLWALVEYQKLGKERLKNGFQFIDLF